MSEVKEISGGCQCGAVRYTIVADRLKSYVCHCRECQKQSASAFGISVLVRATDLELCGETASWSRPSDSGSRTNCHFCVACGTRLYHQGDKWTGMVTIKGGSLDDAAELQPVAHIWTSSKQGWVDIPADVPSWQSQPPLDEWAKTVG